MIGSNKYVHTFRMIWSTSSSEHVLSFSNAGNHFPNKTNFCLRTKKSWFPKLECKHEKANGKQLEQQSFSWRDSKPQIEKDHVDVKHNHMSLFRSRSFQIISRYGIPRSLWRCICFHSLSNWIYFRISLAEITCLRVFKACGSWGTRNKTRWSCLASASCFSVKATETNPYPSASQSHSKRCLIDLLSRYDKSMQERISPGFSMLDTKGALVKGQMPTHKTWLERNTLCQGQ